MPFIGISRADQPDSSEQRDPPVSKQARGCGNARTHWLQHVPWERSGRLLLSALYPLADCIPFCIPSGTIFHGLAPTSKDAFRQLRNCQNFKPVRATQVLHHWGGSEWQKRNEALRDRLIETQVKRGNAAGSWKPTGDSGTKAGGRLYQTCLSIMTLEVYYRYLPLYQRDENETAHKR
jgi:hypothetical protein